MMATGLVAIDSTIIATAVPSIVSDLGSFSSFPWLFSVYLLTSAVTVPVYSKLADTIGRRPVLLFGIAVFLAGSIVAGVAWSMPILIIARAIQGIGAGAILPLSITIVGDIYTIEERARVQGYIASVWAIAAVVGPTLGGVFAQLGIWRGIFLVNIPLCIAAAWLVIRNFRETVEKRSHRIDYAGAALLTASMTLVMLGVLEGGTAWAWNSPASIAIFGAGAVLLVVFLLVERRATEPVLPLHLFQRRIISSTTVLGFGIGVGLVGLTAFIPTYLEVGTGASPLVAGLALATFTIGWPIAASLAGRFYLRIGFRTTTIMGGVIVVAGTVVLALLAPHPSIALVAISCFFIGAGFGFAAVPSLVAAQASVDWNERGVVTGSNMFARSLGQSMGAAVLGAIANSIIAGMGGNAHDAHTIVTASVAVFIAVAVIAVGILLSAIWMPRVVKVVPVVLEPATDATGPLPTAG
ncbi:MFS transporter [Microbacterium sp. ASV49]|uniref:MFS transporter n=1 Tax=Microbacterium candidum TaxID=3041922 RepID=A0ABT7N4D5_9MICO|nr:MFS transporter [Microbacterium sp. ASV49]MDL9981559.1 MFS transporter [Microbacterium sp. ASV49]